MADDVQAQDFSPRWAAADEDFREAIIVQVDRAHADAAPESGLKSEKAAEQGGVRDLARDDQAEPRAIDHFNALRAAGGTDNHVGAAVAVHVARRHGDSPGE